jgi:O-antigen/teichoic acid export membrane protein
MTTEARQMSRNLSLISINKVIQLMGGALWALIIPRWMGPEAYGQFALATAISLLLWWAGDFGGLEVFGRHLPTLREKNPEEARQLFAQTFLLRVLVAILLIPLMLVAGPLIAPWLRGWPSFLIAASAGLHIISWTSYHTLYAQNEMGKWSVEISWRLTVQLPLILLVASYGLVAQMAAYMFTEIIFLAIAVWWTRAWFSEADFRPNLRFLRPYMRMGVGFWATNVGIILLFRTGTILVQILTGDSVQVSYYDLALVVFFLIFTIVDQLTRAFLPTVSEFEDEGQKQRLGNWLQVVTSWGTALAMLAVVGVQYTADWIMPFILGSDYAASAPVLRIMLLALPALVLVGVGTVATAVRQSARAKIIAIAIGIVIFWGGSAILAPRLGATGAAWALSLGLITYALALFAQVREDLQFRWGALIAIIALALPLLALTPLLTSNILLALAVFAAVSLLYLGVCLLLKLLPPEPLQLVGRLVRRKDQRSTIKD